MILNIIASRLRIASNTPPNLRLRMRASRETVIATLSAQDDTQRLEVVLLSQSGGESRLQLRQQSWGDGVGWFTQSSVELEPQQLAALKMTLGTVPAKARRQTAPMSGGPASMPGTNGALRLVQADSA